MSTQGTSRFSGISPRNAILTNQQAGDESSDRQNNGSGVGGVGAVPDSIRSMSSENSNKRTQEVVADMVSFGLSWLSSQFDKLTTLFDDSEDDASVAMEEGDDVCSTIVHEDLGASQDDSGLKEGDEDKRTANENYRLFGAQPQPALFEGNENVNGKSVDDDEALRPPEHLDSVSLDELAEAFAITSGAGDDIEVKEKDVKTPPVTPPVTPINLPQSDADHLLVQRL